MVYLGSWFGEIQGIMVRIKVMVAVWPVAFFPQQGPTSYRFHDCTPPPKKNNSVTIS